MNDPWTATRGDSETMITFPQPAALINMNDRMHWRPKARLTAAWRRAAHQAALLLGPPAQRVHGPSWVQVHIPVPGRLRQRDPANLTPVTKACVDGLVDAGVWPTDTPEFVTTIEPALYLDKPPKGYSATVRITIHQRTGGTPPCQ